LRNIESILFVVNKLLINVSKNKVFVKDFSSVRILFAFTVRISNDWIKRLHVSLLIQTGYERGFKDSSIKKVNTITFFERISKELKKKEISFFKFAQF